MLLIGSGADRKPLTLSIIENLLVNNADIQTRSPSRIPWCVSLRISKLVSTLSKDLAKSR